MLNKNGKPRPNGWEFCDTCNDYHAPIESIAFWIYHHLPEKHQDEFVKRWCETINIV